MKRATLFVIAVCAYWCLRMITAPAPETVSASISELQIMEAEHLQQNDWGSILEEHADITPEAE